MLVIGMKSYGRNSAFLLTIGHQQVRDGAACVLCMLALHTAAGHSLCSSPSTSSAEFFGPMKHYAPSAHLLLRCCLFWVGFQVDDAMAVITKLINELSSAA